MKKLILSALLIFILPGCDESVDTDHSDTIHGSGNLVTQPRILSECSAVRLESYGNIFLSQDDEQSIVIEADDNIINDVVTRVENGTLSISLLHSSYSEITLNVYLSVKTIRSIFINGAGRVAATEAIACDTLLYTLNGAGNTELIGSAVYLNCLVNGAGTFEARNFIAEKCRVSITGAGNCTVNVTEKLDASIIGTGRIIYYGNPDSVKTYISGTGQIIKI